MRGRGAGVASDTRAAWVACVVDRAPGSVAATGGGAGLRAMPEATARADASSPAVQHDQADHGPTAAALANSSGRRFNVSSP